MQDDLNALAFPQFDTVGSADHSDQLNERTRGRMNSSYYDGSTLWNVVEKARVANREGDCPIQPVLCYDINGWVALCLACSTSAKHYVAMSRLDMYTPAYYEDKETFELVENTGSNHRIYGIALSGKTRRFKMYRQQFIFNQKIQLPIDKLRAGVAKLNVRMIVDGYDDVINCPVVEVAFAGKRNFFSGPLVPRRRRI